MKKRYLIYALLLFMIPTLVFAQDNIFDSFPAIFFALFISLFHLFFIVGPINTIRTGGFGFDFKSGFKIYAILVAVNTFIAFALGNTGFFISFFSVFAIGFPAMFALPFANSFHKTIDEVENPDPAKTIQGCVDSIAIRCIHCNGILKPTDKFCQNCGAEFTGNNAKVASNDPKDLPLKIADLDGIYAKSDEELFNDIINQEMKALKFSEDPNMIPRSENIRLNILNIFFGILIFLFIGLIFYHVSLVVYVMGIIVLLVFYLYKRKFDIHKYILKEIKARPEENIDNIIGAINENLVKKKSLITGIVLPVVVIVASLFVFKEPIILYEPIEGGYAMRFYFTGWDSLYKAEIPAEHNGKPVVSLRGNAFSNLPLLKEVYLPDSITEIRGEAFKNDISLEKVHLPAKLEYLGGESFYKCSKLKEVNLTYETPLTEIKGDTFEECTSLTEITIPDSVTKIASHAFYGDTLLSKVNISNNSKLKEIGSSAFRLCKSLRTISIPSNVSVNSKAFKESPTVVSKFGSSVTTTNPDSPTTSAPTGNDTVYKTILMHEGDIQSVTIPNYGTINISYQQYLQGNRKKIRLSGYLSKSIDATGNYTLSLGKNGDRIEFLHSNSNPTLYISIILKQ